jgi:hypothetical protein
VEEYPEKTTDLPQITATLLYGEHLARAGILDQNQYLRIKRQTSVGLLFVTNMSYLPTWLLIALFLFVKIITFGV